MDLKETGEMEVKFNDFDCSYDCLKKVLVLLNKAFNRSNLWFDNEDRKHDDDYQLLEDKLLKRFFELWAAINAENFHIKSQCVGLSNDLESREEYIEIKSDFSSDGFFFIILLMTLFMTD